MITCRCSQICNTRKIIAGKTHAIEKTITHGAEPITTEVNNPPENPMNRNRSTGVITLRVVYWNESCISR